MTIHSDPPSGKKKPVRRSMLALSLHSRRGVRTTRAPKSPGTAPKTAIGQTAADATSSALLRRPALARLTQGLRLTTALCSVLVVLPVLSSGTAWALPQDGVVATGTAKIVTKPTKVIIIQKTPSVVIDWKSFNIATGERVVIKQHDASWTALNRVTGGGGASMINGSLSAMGTVAISNPAVMTFGAAARINVG
jgi:filamentous hemagglutinin family protein